MKRAKNFFYKRLIWYFIGFLLFYAPVAAFQRGLALILHTEGNHNIHTTCFRCGILGITGGIEMDILSTRGISIIFLLLISFLLGPVFCRYFCVAGALTECLSRIMPDSLKVRWHEHINPVPIKYGILTGFLITPFLGFSVVCAYCNLSLSERIILGTSDLDIGVLSSANILTMVIWLTILGAFTKGGRGFCSYLCPVGAAQILMHSIGSKLKFTYKLKLIAERCSLCGVCTTKCPMGALYLTNQGLRHQIHNCITCNECVNACSKAALIYGPSLDDNELIERQYHFIEKG